MPCVTLIDGKLGGLYYSRQTRDKFRPSVSPSSFLLREVRCELHSSCAMPLHSKSRRWYLLVQLSFEKVSVYAESNDVFQLFQVTVANFYSTSGCTSAGGSCSRASDCCVGTCKDNECGGLVTRGTRLEMRSSLSDAVSVRAGWGENVSGSIVLVGLLSVHEQARPLTGSVSVLLAGTRCGFHGAVNNQEGLSSSIIHLIFLRFPITLQHQWVTSFDSPSVITIRFDNHASTFGRMARQR